MENKKLIQKIDELWKAFREDLTPSEKGQLTKFKNFIQGEDVESLAKSIALYASGNSECMGMFKKGYLNYFVDEFPENDSKFVAFYSDGSGCNLFTVNSEGQYTGFEVGEVLEKEWFLETDYGGWQYLPDNFDMWL